MDSKPDFNINDRWIISSRGKKNNVTFSRPYAYLVEKERTASGLIEDVATIFLTNRECPYHCLMCDLWKNTTDTSVPAGAIPAQIEWALNNLPAAKHLKLYNSGSFFDKRAIPPEDFRSIASLVSGFESVIVECHPKLINETCLKFRDILKPQLQVALGLETSDPDTLQKLNKQMTPEDFRSATVFLSDNEIPVRAFILLRPPFLTEQEGVRQAEKSVEYAFNSGAGCCVVIPVRAGNGAMDELLKKGLFTPPDLRSLEKVTEYCIGLNKGRVFADLWDLKLFSKCDNCLENRISRLSEMNLTQKIPPGIKCDCTSE